MLIYIHIFNCHIRKEVLYSRDSLELLTHFIKFSTRVNFFLSHQDLRAGTTCRFKQHQFVLIRIERFNDFLVITYKNCVLKQKKYLFLYKLSLCIKLLTEGRDKQFYLICFKSKLGRGTCHDNLASENTTQAIFYFQFTHNTCHENATHKPFQPT